MYERANWCFEPSQPPGTTSGLMYERTTQHLNYGGRKSLYNFFFAVYDIDISVTLKQGESLETWYELVNPNQNCNNAKFEKSRLNSVREKKKKKP